MVKLLRRHPIQIKALQYTGENANEIAEFLNPLGLIHQSSFGQLQIATDPDSFWLAPTEWIVFEANGFYKYSNEYIKTMTHILYGVSSDLYSDGIGNGE